jgi:hypothetical protein
MSKVQTTLNLVERTIRNSNEYLTKQEIYHKLHQIDKNAIDSTLEKIEDDKKIGFDKDGAIIWMRISDPKKRKILIESLD